MLQRFAVAALLSAVVSSPAVAGPPWISIELPANPYDPSTRGAFLVVHAYHHDVSLTASMTGTATGMVKGQRRTIQLRFEKTSRPGVYALKNQWGREGRWVLVLSADQGGTHGMDAAEAMVEIAEGGTVTEVRVPTTQEREGAFPRKVTAAEIDAALAGTPRK